MSCLKCGKKTENEQAFCNHCLEEMAKHPVKPDTVITLPRQNRNKTQVSRKRPLQPEEQLLAMHRLVRRLIAALIAVTILFILSAAGLVYNYKNSEAPPTIGRNYTTNIN